jgi:transposase
MLIITRQERERLVIDLYNQGKTIREIAKELGMSPNTITTILKKKEQRNNSIVTNN